MRHRVDHRKLGRTAAHRRALMRSMVTSLFQAERITTTAPKAKEARRVAERLITRAKKGYRAHQEGMSLKSSGKEVEAKQLQGVALAHWRQAGRLVRSPEILRKLFDQIAPHYLERNGGYTRIIRLDNTRVGDNARLVLLELVDTDVTRKPLMRGVAPEEEVAAEKPKKGRKAKAAAETAEATEKKPRKEKKDKPAAARSGEKRKARADDSGKKAVSGARSKSKGGSKARKSES
jgi:large subunit ribosomal protein L17